MIKLKIGTKICLGFLLLLTLIVLLGTTSILLMESIKEKTNVIEKSAKQTQMTMGIEKEFKEAVSSMQAFVGYGNEDYIVKSQQSMVAVHKKGDELLKVVSTKDKSSVQALIKLVSKYEERQFNEITPLIRKFHRAVASGDVTKAQELRNQTLNLANEVLIVQGQIEAELTQLTKKNNDIFNSSLQLSIAQQSSVMTMTLAFTLCAVIVGTVLSLLLTRIIRLPIIKMASEAEILANGDLRRDIAVKSTDELGQLAVRLNKMRLNFKGIITKLGQSAGSLTDKANSLALQSQKTSRGATTISNTTNQIAVMMAELAHNTQVMHLQAEQASQRAQQGYEGISQVTGQMQEILTASLEVNTSMDALGSAIGKVSQFVEAINSIAERTNLLALNAAIEAARAGEDGRGFSIVADEVRKLAEQAARSTKEVSSLINEIQDYSSKSQKTMSNSNEKITRGNLKVSEMGQLFHQIIKEVQQLTQQVQYVATASQQIASGAQNMAATSQEQTATMEEVNVTAANLTALARELEGLMSRFKI